MKTKLTKKFWISLALFGLMGQIAWVVENMYLNVFMYKMFAASAEDISAMVGASAIAATLTTVLIGALSDRIGKRKVFICGGYILWGISIFAFSLLKLDIISGLFPMVANGAALGITLTIALDCIMTFFGSSANDAAFNAWLTDSTDSSNRGSAEGINAMMPLVAILAVFGGFMAFDLNQSQSWTMIFTIIGVAVILIGVLGFFIIEETKTPPSQTGYFKNVIYGFRPSTIRSNPAFYFYLVAFIIFNISIQIFMPYLIIYYEVSLGMKDYVLIMAPAIILASAVTAFWGKVYDKKGFGFSGAFSLIWLILGYIMLYLFKDTAPVFIGSLLMMSGYLAGMAVFGAKIRDLTPLGKAGMLQGVRIFSQVLVPGVIGPFIGQSILANAEKIQNSDGTESFVPNANIFLGALIPILILAVVLFIYEKNKKPRTCQLKTPFEENDNNQATWSEYPRPQLARESYISLCGEWELSVISKSSKASLGKIIVPFPPESRLSGIERAIKKGEKYLYSKEIDLSLDASKRIILHADGIDQCCIIKINGSVACENRGGYLPIEAEISSMIKDGKNLIEIEVWDDLDTNLAYGKQTDKRGGMWYTSISGIWKSVWLEAVPQNYIKGLKITPSMSSVKIEIDGGEDKKTLTLYDGESEIKYDFEGNKFELCPSNPKLWSPESPYLYYFSISDGVDKISSYFALREISIEQINKRSYICLNKKPYFCHGLLDQGYYSDGIYTPSSPDALKFDILKMKELGFNTLRKHIKIEHELFYYYCDKYGMLVFQDMVNSGKYSFLIDTALPTAGVRKGITHKACRCRKDAFESDCRKTIDLLYNHPSVVYYTIFNEGWGQYDADRIYTELKEYEPTRIFDSTSGWFTEKKSDVTSEHIYFKPLSDKNMPLDPNRPMVLSEFGGYSCKIEDHSFNLDKTYGYKTCKTPKELESDLEKLYCEQVIPQIKRGLCATIYTQVSDVEDETNGLLTYDRQITKVSAEKMQEISQKLNLAFNSQF